jgi:hypothetical protein
MGGNLNCRFDPILSIEFTVLILRTIRDNVGRSVGRCVMFQS